MKARCYTKTNTSYPRYGKRGIYICDEWLIWDNFYEWSMRNGYEKGLSIDRINNDGIYEPLNCRWTTSKEQVNNRNITLRFTINGETKLLTEWCNEKELKYSKIRARINDLNWSPEEALEFIPRNKSK